VEHLIAIFQAPTGDWWIAYNNELLGYYPATLFKLLNTAACRTAWYGEVARVRWGASTSWVKTEMGSGKFAEAGRPNAAYVRNPKYYDISWFGQDPQDQYYLEPNKPQCYNRSALLKEALDVYLFIGGPGGKDPGCQWP
jgi:hypothetical protein